MTSQNNQPQRSLNLLTVPGWRAFPWLVHGFSTRQGGTSTAYRPNSPNLNLGFTEHDARENVLANRRLLLASLVDSAADQPSDFELLTIRQVHSATIRHVGRTQLQNRDPAASFEGDGMITNEPGILLGILTADCVPVLVVDPVRRAIGAFHAGWRGTARSIVELGIEQMVQRFDSDPGSMHAAIGPSIGPCCYAVGEEVRQQFLARFAYGEALFRGRLGEPATAASTYSLDLAEANRRQLLAAGLSPASIVTMGHCTSCNRTDFFSHRAEQGRTGRMMAILGMSLP